MQHKFTFKNHLKRAALTLLALIMTCATAWAQFSGGSGTEADPYLISSLSDLSTLRSNVNGGNHYTGQWFKQTADIDLSGVTWGSGIGQVYNKFGGNYDGNHKKISNLTSTQIDFYGLFYYVENENAGTHCVLKNIRLVDCNINKPTGSVGGIVHSGKYCDIIGCEVTGSIKGTENVGGIAAYMEGGSINGCFVSGTVQAKSPAASTSGTEYWHGMIVGYMSLGNNSSTNITGSGNTYISEVEGVGGTGHISGQSNASTLTTTAQPISGTTDNGLSWTLGGTYHTELTVSGSAAIPNYGYTTVDGLWRTNAPWGWHLTKVTVADGVTGIGNYAFIGAQSVESVTIGNSVASIGIGAINHCDLMTTVTLPASVNTIGYAAFENCQALTTIYINSTGAINLTGSNNNHFNAPNLDYIVFSTPAGAVANTQTTGNWSPYQGKIRAQLGSQLFYATNEGGTPAYKIATATDLNNLSTAVNGGANGSGQTFRQTADITVSGFTPIGSSQTNYFGGTYDGGNKTLNVTINDTQNQGTALFRNIKGATIKNLILTGSVTGTIHAAALVGFSRTGGTNTIERCKVAANVTVTTPSGNNYHCGGVVGHALTSTLNISKTLYCGTITNSGNYVGGFQGWSDGSTINISDCLFAGTYTGTTTGTALFHPIALRNNNSANTAVASNTYYDITPTVTNSNFIAADGKKTTAVATAPSNLGSTVETLSFMTVYQNGILYNGNYYAAPELPSGGTDIYLINNADHWTAFCDMLDNGETFSGKTVKLGANISVTRVAGSESHDFKGTFNGQNNTLTFTCTNTTQGHVAPFGYVRGTSANHAAITNLNVVTTITSTGNVHYAGLIALQRGIVDITNCNAEVHLNCSRPSNIVEVYPAGLVSQAASDDNGTLTISGCTTTGTIATDGMKAGGMVGIVQGSATITNSVSSVTINSSTAGDGTHGGFVGVASSGSTTIEGCLFNGKLLSVGETATGNCGGFVGWRGSTLTISNSLYAPAELGSGENEVEAGSGDYPSCTFARNLSGTPTNSYYTRTLGTVQGKQRHSITAGQNVTSVANAGTPATDYSVSGITSYGTGIKYNNVLYAGNGDAVSLTLNHSEAPTGYTFNGYAASAGTLDGTTLTMPNENVTISATMTPNTYYVHFDGNGSTDGTMSDQTFTYDEAQDLTANAFTRTGYTFDGWNTQANGSGTGYDDEQSVINLTDQGTVTLYAQWTANTYTVQFDGNGSTNGSMSDQTFTYNVAQNLTANAFTRTGYTFDGWNTQANGSGDSYSDGEEVSNLTDQGTVTLYAQWTANTYTVHFDGNGSTGGSMSDQTFNYDEAQNLNANAFTRTSYAFTDWNTQANGSGTGYDDEQSVINLTESGTVTLYAQWESIAVSYLDEDGVEQQCTDYTLLTGNETYLADGWYVAEDTVTFNSTISINGDVHLILKDGAVMNVGTEGSPIDTYGISDYGHPLSIYAQSTGADKGQLHVYSSQYGINALSSASVTINGGEVTATGTYCGIIASSDCAVTINGGKVTATGTNHYGIYANKCTLTINGGEVTAIGENIGIYANDNEGTLTISGGQVAAIGNGDNSYGIYASNGSVNINGGQVTAHGNNSIGVRYSNGAVTISGGEVTATGTVGFGVNGGTVTISGGQVTALTDGYGFYIYNNGSVTLGWTNPSDFIFADYCRIESGTVSIAEGKAFITDDGTTYQSGELTSEQRYAIAGKKLYPYVEGSVHYLDMNGQRQMRLAGEYITLTNSMTTLGTAGEETWYVVNDTINFTNTIITAGDVHFILKDGAVMNVGTENSLLFGEGIGNNTANSNISIYGQSTGENQGQLFVYSLGPCLWAYNGDFNCSSAKITAYSESVNGIKASLSVTLKDATINPTTPYDSGIHSDGTITINGGKVTASGYNDGIYANGAVTINGGTVTVAGNDVGIDCRNTVTINGGQVTASGNYCGILAFGDITLGWTNTSDFIHVNKYAIEGSGNHNLTLANAFIDEDGQSYTGIIEQVDGAYPIDGKTLYTYIMGSVPYLDMNGERQFCTEECTPLASNMDRIGTEGQETWYVANDTINFTNTISVKGDVHIILKDRAVVNFGTENNPINNNVISSVGHSLSIYGQSTGENNGQLNIYSRYFCIYITDGDFNCSSARVTASCISTSYGIFVASTNNSSLGHINLKDATINASGSRGIQIDGITMAINGGQVTANGNDYGIYACNSSSITISDGIMTATGNQGDGIYVDNSDMTISGGQVTATGARRGIYAISSGTVTIGGGQVMANGTTYYGICANNGTVTINGGHVTANGNNGIRASSSNGSVNINGGQVTANGTTYGIYAYFAGTVNINGGQVTANGNTYGIYAEQEGSCVTLSWTNATDSIFANSYGIGYTSSISIAEGKAFIDGNGNTYYNGTLNSEQFAAMAGQTLTPGEATVTYLDMNGELQTCTEFTPLTGTITNTGLADGWYVAEGNVTFNSSIAVNGDAHLILKDGAVVNVGTESSPISNYGINADGHSLSIYGQSTGENKGQLNVYSNFTSIYASNASVNLNGGQVTASGAFYGIYAYSGGTVTINGGQVTATGTSNSGIHAYTNTGSVTINGGQVTANGASGIYAYNGGTVTISGGEVTTNGSSFGIYAFNGSITLGWTNLTDFIHASRYSISETGSISIAEGKVFIDDDGNTYESGPLSSEQLAALVDKTLHPLGEDAVTYLDMNGQQRYCQAYTFLTGSETEPLTTGWYVADGTINFTSTILVNGDIHIILKDNAVMNVGTEDSPVQTGIEGIIQQSSNINIYGQSTGENNGQLNIYATYVDIWASGGDFNCSSARVTTSLATGTSIYATSSSGTGGNITLKDATVNVSGPIGLQANGNLTINGGEVNATATANYGIGIYAQGGSVTINGGEVTATATASNGYGIQAQNGSVTINGGQVTATGNGGSGFGIMAYGSGSSVNINGGQVTASGYYGIFAPNGNITLGWNNATDFILANSYSASGTVSIAEGKTFIAENAIYNGTIAQVSETYPIDGKTLYPAVAIALDEGLTAVSGIIAYGGNLYAKVGETVTINTNGASIPAGYTFTVIPEIPVTDNGNGNYSFIVPAVDVSVSCTNFTSTGQPVAVSYIDANGSLQEHLAIALDGTMTTLGSEGEETWYFVGTDIYTMNAITLANGGTVHLILVDGKTMNMFYNPDFYNSDSYSIGGASDLTIYGQAQGTGTLYTANTIEAINITINGGTVNAKTFDENSPYPFFFVSPPAIRSNGNFVINDGTLYTEGSYGILVAPPNGTTPIEGVTYSVTINGGKVTAIGHSVGSGFGEPEQYHGIAAMGSITLGWKNNSDYIYTNTYASSGTLSIAEGKAFIDEDGNTYSGIIEQVDDAYSIDGKTLYPWSDNAITYLDENGQQQYCAAYTTLTGSENSLGTANQETWYVADGNVSYTSTINVAGDVHLILKDGAVMNVGTESSRIDPFGISVEQSISIYAQSTGESKGQLNVYGTGAGIISNYGSVTINGGEVTTTGNTSGIYGNGIIINGGEVTASGYHDCGIESRTGSDVTINGGQLTVSGVTGIHTITGNVNINGGQVMANTEFKGILASYGDVNINGGQVTASGEDGGITASGGNINLGWTHATDFIQASSYVIIEDGTLTLAKNFIDEDGILYEMGIIQQVNGAYPIDEKKLMPCGVPYLDENGEQQFCVEYIALDGTETELGIEDEETWYVVNSDVSYTDLWIYGDVHLILVDGKTMSAQCESNFGAIMGYADLTIYGQSQGTGTLASSGAIAAMDITMNGGTVNVNATNNYAIYTMGDFIINDGTLYTEGATGIMAQSMGAKASPASEVTSNITINGGKVTAIGTYSGNGVAFGMGATGIITLGWKNNTDYIYSNGYYADSIIRIVEGKAFIDEDGNTYSGVIDTLSGGYYPINGKTLYPWSENAITYLDENGQQRYCAAYTTLTGSETDLTAGWYVADGTLNYTSTISTTGDVHLILKDGAVMNVGTENIAVSGNGISLAQSLSIYAQSTGESKGQLNVYASAQSILANYGSITINGGQVTADGYYCGIGGVATIINGGQVTTSGMNSIECGNLTINGGQVTVSGNTGIHTSGGNVNINGGQVTANGVYVGILASHGDVNISGGQVTASGEEGSIIVYYGNINLGWTHATDFIQASSYLIEDGTLTLAKNFIDEDGILYEMGVIEQEDGTYPIDGKKLMPTGVPYLDENGEQQICVEYIALDGTETQLGIEDEETWYVVNSDVSYTNLWIYGDVHLILVDGKTMSAQCESDFGAIMGFADLTIYGQAQGTGALASSGAIAAEDITMNGGTVNVNATDNYAIYSMGDFIINDGTLHAEGAVGIVAVQESQYDTSTHNITINGGKVTAIGTYSGNGVAFGMGAMGNITLGWRNADDYIYCSRYHADSILRIAEGKAFIDGNGNTYSGVIDTVSGGYYPFDGDTLRPYGISTFTKEILARTGNNTGNNTGWYLIASPIGEVAPANVGDMLSNRYDLYRFNQSAELEWENWKAEGEHYHFNLEPGRGYLYSNSQDVTLTFTGMPYSDDGTVTLDKTAGAEFAGWNLVGNPFAEIAYLPAGRGYYTLNENGSEVAAAVGNSVEAMEGIFVIAEEDGETLTFSTTPPELPNGMGLLSINVTKTANHRDGTGLIDRAIVRFDEGGTLPKFQLNPNSTKVYIPMDGEDYAVVRSEGMGEIPVNFKAEENGTYNLWFSSTDVTFSYLHLIDNLTGADVDLLALPSYTFTSRTTDYASRFKLVFVTNNEDGPSTGSGTFAFCNNGNWIIANEGEATLQVIDVNGRILSSETVNGSVSKAIHAATGIYMLRLINGEDVRTQKIVVE